MTTDAREVAIQALVQDGDAMGDTIEVVREKPQGDDAVVAVTFRRPSGRMVRGFVGLHRFDDLGWRPTGAWSSGSRDVPADAIWASSGGWGSVTPTRGVSGGWVTEPAARVIRVTDPNGRIEEDAIEAGAAILIWEGRFDVSRATAELGHGVALRLSPRPRARPIMGRLGCMRSRLTSAVARKAA